MRSGKKNSKLRMWKETTRRINPSRPLPHVLRQSGECKLWMGSCGSVTLSRRKLAGKGKLSVQELPKRVACMASPELVHHQEACVACLPV